MGGGVVNLTWVWLGAIFGFELAVVMGLTTVVEWDSFLDFLFNAAEAWEGVPSPATPPKSGEIAPPAAASWRRYRKCGGTGVDC